VNAVLEVALAPHPKGTRVYMVFHVAGPAAVNAGRYADALDKVFAEAFPRLLSHKARPKPPEEEEAKK